MKLSLKLVLLFSLGLLIPGLSVAEISPYVGADLVLRGTGLKGNNGSAFPKRAYGANVYGGLQFLSNLEVEVGTNAVRHSKNNASTKVKSFHTSLVGNYPISSQADNNLNFIGSAGLSHLKYKHSKKGSGLNYKKIRPRVSLGVEYGISPSVSWRTMGLWEGRFGKKPVNYAPKQAFGVSTGLGYKF